ncbi:MAG: hypothetical protein AAF990_13285 [Bacteroidota bacterium]
MDDSSVHIDKTMLQRYQNAHFRFDTLRFSFQIEQTNEEMDVFLLDNQADEWLVLVFAAKKDRSAFEQHCSGRIFDGYIEKNGQRLAEVLLLLDIKAENSALPLTSEAIVALVSGRFQRPPKITYA